LASFKNTWKPDCWVLGLQDFSLDEEREGLWNTNNLTEAFWCKIVHQYLNEKSTKSIPGLITLLTSTVLPHYHGMLLSMAQKNHQVSVLKKSALMWMMSIRFALILSMH